MGLIDVDGGKPNAITECVVAGGGYVLTLIWLPSQGIVGSIKVG